jgi:putative transposase
VEEIRQTVLFLLQTNAAKSGVDLMAIEAIADHVHLLLVVPADRPLAQVMHQLKGASAREVLRKYPELRLDMESNSLWQKSYGARLVPPDQLRAVKTQSDRPLRHE